MKSFILLAFLIFLAPFHAAHAESYEIACKLSLIGGQGAPLIVTKVSPSKASHEGPVVNIDLGAYVYLATLRLEHFQNTLRPNLEVIVFEKAKGPIVGQVNFTGATGISATEMGPLASVYGINFLNMTMNGRAFTRLDDRCTLSRRP